MSNLERTLEDFYPTEIETRISDVLKRAAEGNDPSEELAELVERWNDEMQAECDSLGDSHEARAEGRVRMEMRRALVYYSSGFQDDARGSLLDALTLIASDAHGNKDVLNQMVYDLGDSLFEEGWENSQS